MRLTFLSKYREAGLLLLRVSLALLFLYLTVPVVLGGARAWAHFGQPLRHFGLRSHLEWWGLAGASAQMLGAILMLVGWFFRPGIVLVAVWVVLHTVVIWKSGGLAALVSLELCLILVSLLFIGPGKYSGDKP